MDMCGLIEPEVTGTFLGATFTAVVSVGVVLVNTERSPARTSQEPSWGTEKVAHLWKASFLLSIPRRGDFGFWRWHVWS